MEPVIPNRTPLDRGLTEEQVADKKVKGQYNKATDPITKSNGQIVKENLATLFNLFNLLIALCLGAVGAYSNLFFIVIILLNVTIGIAQEIHAKNLIEKLSLLSAPKATVRREGTNREIPTEEIVLDDLLIFEAGSQIVADSLLVEGSLEVNESLLTGESDVVLKQEGDRLLSGSFVVSGRSVAQVEHVGVDNYSVALTNQAKAHRKVHSQLMAAIRKVTKMTGFLIVPLGAILFLQAFVLRQDLLDHSVIVTAAALLGMLPKGLVLLISIALATGVIKLSKERILVQEMFALEALAHVDLLCLDKTGTLTQGKMTVQSVTLFETDPLPVPFEELIGSFLQVSDDNNATFLAMKEYFPKNGSLEATGKVPFSSQRRWSMVSFGEVGSLVIGAPERLTAAPLPKDLAALQDSGARLLFVGYTPDRIPSDTKELPVLRILGAVAIADPLREHTRETLAFFQREGVRPVIISGDNPGTVSAIAVAAGLADGDRAIDFSTVNSNKEIVAAAKEYSVFGRVSPQQKKQLVAAFKAQGHTVAMTGDGVNDILALREADCSIAMGEGSDAARQVSQLVLLDSDFAALPLVLSEGRRAVNNVTRVAGIFFVKTIYSILLTLLCILGNLPFPFIPIQITLIDLAIEGYPAFFLSFEPDNRKVRGAFLPTVLSRALPNALAIVLTVVGLWAGSQFLAVAPGELNTIMYYIVGLMGITAVWKACMPLNPLRIFLCVTMTGGFYLATLLFHSLLKVTILSGRGLLVFLGAAVVSLVLDRLFALLVRGIAKAGSPSL